MNVGAGNRLGGVNVLESGCVRAISCGVARPGGTI